MAQYRNRTELVTELTAQGLKLPLSENIQVLQKPLLLRGKSLANRIAVQPMEGCDGTADGKPGELTLRRYDRFASGGAGLLWFEAVAVMEEGRANPRQLMITENSLDSLKRVTARIKEIGMRENGYEPLIIMQATHSGWYSKPQGTPSPIIASNNPLIEKDTPLPPSCIITDDHIREIVECFGSAAKMAERAGFDGIDIKSCHGYLGCELLSAYQRSGAYGGSFENRTRFLREGIANATASTTSNFLVTSRLNIYDGLPYPHGFGVTPQGN
ncbi:MAG: flavin oxidoreductase/NADH oxidase, partial [Angelakisella sp.]